MKQKIRFIINPISGVGKKGELPRLIEQNLDHSRFEYDIKYTEYRKHAKEIARTASHEGVDIVCAVGGDGSVHEVGTALIGTATKLAIIPCGSGNGLARHLGIPVDIEKSILTINTAPIFKMDTVLVNDKPFLGIGGYGFDAHIAKMFDNYHKRGFWSYVKLVVKEFATFKPVKIEVEINGKKETKNVFLCNIANASEFGNGFVISPNSDITDGQIELCFFKPFSPWLAPFVVRRFFKRTVHQSRYSEIIQVKKARLTLSKTLAHYDGEPFQVREELNVEVIPQSLNILTGNKK